MKKILISTGGSGGHIIPAISLYEHFSKKFDVFLVTDKRGTKFINYKIFPYDVIEVPNIFSSFLKIPINIFFFILAFLRSFFYIRKNKIDYLFSTGGYMSLPLCLASKLLKIDIFLFEPNMVIGRSNKIILKFSKGILCYVKDIVNFPKNFISKIILIKPLMRKKIYDLKKNTKSEFDKVFKILILGGSQGAKYFDSKIKEEIIDLSKKVKIQITQQYFDENIKNKLKELYDKNNIEADLFKFDENLFKKFGSFDLAISRAGASALSELAYFNVPFIAIPFPSAKDNHQYYNAKYYLDNNSCWLVKQDELEKKKLSNIIKNLIDNHAEYFNKKENLYKISYQNTWNNVNQKLLSLINEN